LVYFLGQDLKYKRLMYEYREQSFSPKLNGYLIQVDVQDIIRDV